MRSADNNKKGQIMQQEYNLLVLMVRGEGSISEVCKKLRESKISQEQSYLRKLVMELIAHRQKQFGEFWEVLINHQLEPNFFVEDHHDHSNYYLIMWVCQHCCLQTLSTLLAYGQVKVNVLDGEARNVLFYAIRNKNHSFDIVTTLLEGFPQLISLPPSQRIGFLLQLFLNQQTKLLTWILKNIPINLNEQCQVTGNTLLHEVFIHFHPNHCQQLDVDLLLKYTANPSINNFEGKTPFDLAEEKKYNLMKIWKKFTEEQLSVKAQSQILQLNDLTKDEDNEYSLKESDLNSEQSEEQDIAVNEKINANNLSQAIWNYGLKCQQAHFRAYQFISGLYEKLQKLGKLFHLRIDIIGSFAHGLWTPASDIDIVFINEDLNPINIEQILQKMFIYMRNHDKYFSIRKIYLNNKIKFPNISIELNKKIHPSHYQKIDMVIFQKNNNGHKYVKYIRTYLQSYPFIKPLFFMIRAILQKFDLHNPAKGGIKTYALFLMIAISLNYHPFISVGQSFMDFLKYYSQQFRYQESVSQQEGYSIKLNLLDPLNQTNNVGGKHTDIEKFKRTLKVIRYGIDLSQGYANNPLQYLFQLNKIFKTLS